MKKPKQPPEIKVWDDPKFSSVKEKLSHGRTLAYLRYAPEDLKRLKLYSKRLTDPGKDLGILTQRLHKKVLPKLREPLIRGTVEKTVSDLEDVLGRLKKITESFVRTLNGQKQFLADQTKRNPNAKKYNPNDEILSLMELFKNQANLEREFEKHPEMIPPGIKKKLKRDAIRKRNSRQSNRTDPDKSRKKS